MGCQDGSMIPPSASHSTAGVTVVGPASALGAAFAIAATTSRGRMKMSAVIEAVISGVMFLTYPVNSHPVPCPGEARSEVEEGVSEEEDHLSMSSRDVDVAGNSNIPALPPELYSIIASYLHVPSSTTQMELTSCSLASSAWLTASRIYTFRTVTLTYANVYRFLTLLEDPTCSFKRCVRRLEMREGEYAVDRWMNDVLPRLVLDGRMCTVEILDVYNLTWAELSPHAIRALTEGFAFVGEGEEREKTTKIKSLRVGTCYWECVRDFVGFVCSPSFVGLKTLICDSVLLNCGTGSCQCQDAEEGSAETAVVRENGTLNPSREPVPPAISRTLESLYLGLPEEKMLKWFVQQDALCGVEKLGLVVRDQALMELVNRFVERATKVKDMALDLPIGCGLSLAKNTRLRILRLTVDGSLLPLSSLPTSPTSNTYAGTLTWLPDLISSITSPNIRLLILHVDSTFFSVPDLRSLWPWKDFASVVNSLKSVERVVFIVTYCHRRVFNALKEVIKEKTLSGPDIMECKVKVKGIRSGTPISRRCSEVWQNWMED